MVGSRRSGRAAKERVRRIPVQVESPSWPPKFTQTWIQTCVKFYVYVSSHTAQIYLLIRIYTVCLRIYTFCKHSHVHRRLSTPFFSTASYGPTLREGHTAFHNPTNSVPSTVQRMYDHGKHFDPSLFPLRATPLTEAQTSKTMDVIRMSIRNFPRYLSLKRDNNGLGSSRRVSWCTNKQLTIYARSP